RLFPKGRDERGGGRLPKRLKNQAGRCVRPQQPRNGLAQAGKGGRSCRPIPKSFGHPTRLCAGPHQSKQSLATKGASVDLRAPEAGFYSSRFYWKGQRLSLETPAKRLPPRTLPTRVAVG